MWQLRSLRQFCQLQCFVFFNLKQASAYRMDEKLIAFCYNSFLCTFLQAFGASSARGALWPYPLGGSILAWRVMVTMSQTLHRDTAGQPEPQHCVSNARCQDLPFCCCCCFRSWTNRKRLMQQLNQHFLKALVENVVQLL